MEKNKKSDKSAIKTEKKIKKEIKKINKKKTVKPKKENKEIEKVLKEPFLEDIEKIKTEKKKKLSTKIELIIICIFSIIMLILLCNRTFFRSNYKNSKIRIDIPLLMFFKKDDGNKLVFKTLRKSKYLNEYFADKLNGFVEYNCNGNNFYYDDVNQFAIYNIEVDKDFIVKTVTIDYAAGDANCLCNAASENILGKEAEQKCK